MPVGAGPVAHQYCPALGQPGQGAFHHPTLFLPDWSRSAGYGDGECGNGTSIPFVFWAVSSRNGGLSGFGAGHDYTLQSPLQQLRVVDVGSGHHHAQPPSASRRSSCSPLYPGPWGWVQWALPMEQSADCHSQFTPPNSWHSSIRTAQMPSSAPHPTQRWKVRWIVLSSPNSSGKWFHWQPLRIRKTIPSSIFRWSPVCAPSIWAGPTPVSPVRFAPKGRPEHPK